MTTNVFSKGDVLELLMTKFILPTVDVCTDILTIEEILTYSNIKHDQNVHRSEANDKKKNEGKLDIKNGKIYKTT